MATSGAAKNIFMIESPLQLLSAIEAAKHFSCDSNALVFIQNKHPVNIRMMTEILSNSPVSFELVDTISTQSRRALYGGLFNLLRRFKQARFDRVFVGDFNCAYMRIFGANLKSGEVVLLDDGIAALYMEALLEEQRSWRSVTRTYLARIVGITPELELANCVVFSFFKRASTQPKEWIRHHFDYLRTTLRSESVSDEVHLVIGQGGLVGQKFLAEPVYLDLLRDLTRDLKGRILYAPHRHEDKGLVERIASQLGFVVQTFNEPAELGFAKLTPRPATVSAFMSTALFSFKTLYPEVRVRFLRLEGAYLLRRQASISRINGFLKEIAEEVPASSQQR